MRRPQRHFTCRNKKGGRSRHFRAGYSEHSLVPLLTHCPVTLGVRHSSKPTKISGGVRRRQQVLACGRGLLALSDQRAV